MNFVNKMDIKKEQLIMEYVHQDLLQKHLQNKKNNIILQKKKK